MKRIVKGLLKKLTLYEYIKYSRLFKFYQYLFKPSEKKRQANEVHFYNSFLKKGPLIFDIGANDGHKTEAFLCFSNKIVCVEPEIQNYKTLKIRFRKYKKRVFIENVAIGETASIQNFYIHHPGSAFNTLNKKFKEIGEAHGLEKFKEPIEYKTTVAVKTKTLDSLIETYGKPHFIKIDTEGYELYALKGLHQPIAFISLEFIFPEFKEEFNDAVSLLESQFPNALKYNIAISEELFFPTFQNLETVIFFLKKQHNMVFELIVKNTTCVEA